MSRIAVITPIYNGEQYLAATIESVLNQSHVDIEYILVDDGSKDSSRQIAESYSRQDARIRVVTKANGGVASSRNVGVSVMSTEAEFVYLLDQDDLVLPDSLVLLQSALDEHPEASLSFGLSRVICEPGAESIWKSGDILNAPERWQRLTAGGPIPVQANELIYADCVLLASVIQSGTLLHRARIIMEIGFDERLVTADDWVNWVSTLLRGPGVPVQEVVVDYRWHPSNATHLSPRRLEDLRLAGRIIEEILARNPATRSLARDYSNHNIRQQRGYIQESSGLTRLRRRASLVAKTCRHLTKYGFHE